MPRFDGTGPQGMGPGSGWGRGPCGVSAGRRQGMGWGRCWRWFTSKKDEKDALSEEIKATEQDLQAMKERLAEFKDQK